MKVTPARRAPLLPSGALDLEGAVARVAQGRRLVLAVSGGRDSMVLLHAAARRAPGSVAVVATFDHGTGSAATTAAEHVARVASALGFPVVIGHARSAARSEAEWRAGRWAFLRDVARVAGAGIAVAHTSDDQVETVLMRALRGAGARGIAGLYARSSVVRPLLPFSRETVAGYASATGVQWVEDPTNASLAHFRNRVRLQLLPALRAARPGIDAQLLDLARRAATLRNAIEDVASGLTRVDGAVVHVDPRISARSPEELAVLWPAMAARAGIAMDRRGTARAVRFTAGARVGARIQLAGGWEIVRRADGFQLRRGVPRRDASAPEPLAPGTRWDGWRFDAVAAGDDASGAWTAQLPVDAQAVVRAWRPGDRMQAAAGPRRVKRFLRDASVPGIERAGWPVVLVNDEIVWIPGVRRSDAAAVRPGRPGVLYRCELVHR